MCLNERTRYEIARGTFSEVFTGILRTMPSETPIQTRPFLIFWDRGRGMLPGGVEMLPS